MAVYIIVSASTADKALGARETTDAIAAAIGVDSAELSAKSVPLIGEWSGEQEHSRAILLNTPMDVRGWRDVHALAYGLREALGQESVMVLADETVTTLARMQEVFESPELVSISLPSRDEIQRDTLNVSWQVIGDPIIDGVRNGSAWTTLPDEYGSHVVAFV